MNDAQKTLSSLLHVATYIYLYLWWHVDGDSFIRFRTIGESESEKHTQINERTMCGSPSYKQIGCMVLFTVLCAGKVKVNDKKLRKNGAVLQVHYCC